MHIRLHWPNLQDHDLHEFSKYLGHNFQTIPEGHKGEAEKQAKSSPKLSDQGLNAVEKGFCLHQHKGRHVPQHKAKSSKLSLQNWEKWHKMKIVLPQLR